MPGDLLPLLDPDADAVELAAILRDPAVICLYALLYETRDDPLTEVQLRQRFEEVNEPQSQLGRRKRDIYDHFKVEKVRTKGERAPRYVLVGRLVEPRDKKAHISARVRAEVLRLGRCAMCGASPRTEDVRLEVDHKIPQDWGGSVTDPENLQPLCSECNRGKKAYFATFDEHGALIAAACAHPEVHRRIGEMLLAASPHEVRADVLEIVANSGDQQDDWKKRTRELREIGWDYEIKKRTDSDGRRRSYYRLTRSASWPEGPIADAIRAAEKAKKTRR